MKQFHTHRIWAIALLALTGGAALVLRPVPEKVAAATTQTPAVPNVQTIRPVRADMSRSFNTNATMDAYETADLYPKVSGYLAEVRVDIGDHVRAGQLLALVSLPEAETELAQAEATIASKRANVALAQITLKRQEGLLRIQGTSQQTYDEARASAAVAAADLDLAIANADQIKTTLAYTRITAPFDGVIARRIVNRGDFVQSASTGRTTPLFTIQRVDIIRIFCNVPEADVSKLRIGLPAAIKPYGWEEPIIGKVTRFEGRLDPQTRNMRTEIDLPNPDGRLYPGMYAQVALATEIHRGVLAVPAAAIGTDAAGKFVYAVQQNRIVRLPVRTGIVEGGMAELVSGITQDTGVVASIQNAPPPGAATHAQPHA